MTNSNGYGMNGWRSVLKTISMGLYWALVIAGGYRAGPLPGQPRPNAQLAHRTPQQMRAERFARADNEYRQRADVLRSHFTV